MSWSRQLLTALAGAALFYACAYPDFEFDPPKDDDDDVTQGGGGAHMGGNGGGGAIATGGAPPQCDLFDPPDTSCTPGTKCGLEDEDIGSPGGLGCVEAGSRPAWALCQSDPECAPGLFCDSLTNVCRPYCKSANDCPSPAAKCIAAPKSGGSGTIPGVKVCTAHCHPMSASPCDNVSGPTTCFYDTSLVATDCGRTNNINIGGTCSSVLDCARGSLCVNDGGNSRCRRVCTPPGGQAQCAFNEFCAQVTPQLDYNGLTFGVCLALF